jgi:RHS repeat-associated protein
MKKNFFLILLIAISLLSLSTTLKSQTESDNDGVFNISSQDGGASYIYPISKNKIDGFDIAVKLAYIENTPHTSFLEYINNSNRWYKLQKPLPEWFLGVNGFVVQGFSNKIKFQSWHYKRAGDQNPYDYNASYFNWLIEGYDYCNRMKELDYQDAQDIIKILKDDGSVLELRNPIQRKKVSSQYSDSLYRGIYYENGLNTNSYAVVEFDTIGLPSSYYDFIEPGKRNAIYPRKVRLFQGDGLEYVFREMNLPYGKHNYKDKVFGLKNNYEVVSDDTLLISTDSTFHEKIVKPTIFYLEEINSELRNLVEFKRDKHYPRLDSTDCSPGRARLLDFAGHKLSYAENLITLEAFGRTYKVSTSKLFPELDTLINRQTIQGNIQHLKDEIEYEVEQYKREFEESYRGQNVDTIFNGGDNFNYNIANLILNNQGIVLRITDPENRNINFSYDFSQKVPSSVIYKVPEITSSDWKFLNTHLTSIVQPKKKYSIVPHKTTSYSLPNPENYVLNSDYNNICSNYTVSNNLKLSNDNRQVKSEFSNYYQSGSYYDRFTKIRNIFFEGTTAKDTVTKTTSLRHYTASIVIPDTTNEGLTPSLTMLIPEIVVEESSAGITTTHSKYNHYSSFWPSPNAKSYLSYAPVHTKVYFKKKSTDSDNLITYQRHNYSFTDLNLFGNPVLDSNNANLVATDTTFHYFPGDTNKILNYDIKHYKHYGKYVASATRTDTLLLRNETKSANDSIWKFGGQYSVEKYKISTNTGLFIKPTIFYLESKSEFLDSNKVLVAGKINKFQDSSYNPSITSHPRRGALLSDTVVFRNNEKHPANTYKYRGGTYKNFIDYSVDNKGQTTKNHFNYTSTGSYPNGTKILNTNTPSTVKLFKEYPEYESPVATTTYVRRYKPISNQYGNSVVIDSTEFTVFKEETYYGQPKSVIDANGYYAEFEYDKNGRILTDWQPYDFPNSEPRWGGNFRNLYCMPMDSLYTKRKLTVDTLTKKPNSDVTTSPTHSETKVNHVGEVGVIHSIAPNPLTDTNKYVSRQVTSEAVIVYRPSPTDELHSLGSMDSIALKITPLLYGNNMAIDLKLTVDKFGYEKRIMVSAEKLSNASPNSNQINKNTVTKEFSFDLTPIKNALIDVPPTETVEFKISSLSPSGALSILSQSDDLKPCLSMMKFNVPPVLDYTHRYEYNDSTNATNVFSKIDDSLHTAQKAWGQTWNTYFGRYFKVRNFNDMNEATYKSLAYIGHPDSHTRIDSVKTVFDHLGRKSKSFDQNLNSKLYEYQNGELVANHFLASGSSTNELLAKYKFEFGKPDSLVPNYDPTKQNFFKYCTKSTYENANKDRVSIYSDAFGKRRIEVVISRDSSDTTRTYYNYDVNTGELKNVVNTVGDTIKYWYDEYSNLIYKYQKDVGYLSYSYDKYGNLRFSQTQQQAMENKVSFIEYDDMLRPTITGEAVIDTTGLNLVEPLLNPYSTFKRLTDTLNPNKLNYSTFGNSAVGDKGLLTANRTLYTTLSQTYPTTLTIDTVNHIVGGYKFQKDTILARTFMLHSVNYSDNVTPSSSNKDNFENINDNPNFVLNANSYDIFPERNGSVWGNMPSLSKWDTLLQGKAQYKGKVMMTAYRDNPSDNYHYLAFQYDARGRVIKMIRYTENLGFDGVFYKYNSLNQVISVRTIDPHRQFITWYGYDNDGKLEKVWNMLDSANSGFGIGKLKVPQEPNYKNICLQDSFDILYTYNKLGQIVKTNFRKSKVEQRYSFNPKGWLDSTIAEQNYNLIFKQSLTRDEIGNITKQVTQRSGMTADITDYTNDNKYRLSNWSDNRSSSQSFVYDQLGNIKKQFNNVSDSIIYNYSNTYRNRLITTSTNTANVLNKYHYNYNGALTGISDTNTSTNDVKIKSNWKYNSSSFLREYSEFDTTGYYLNNDCNSFGQNALTVNPFGSVWRYKYSAFGTREQKRLLYSPYGDSCTKQFGWVYYLQGVGGEQRAVYKGKQTAKDTLDKTGRRVYLWLDRYNTASDLSYTIDSTQEIQIKDALGSVKGLVKMKKDWNTEITTFDYKPFGEKLRTTELPDEAYIGMELDGERNQYHFNARSYDAGLSRFFSPDLLFEEMPNQSPYSYSNNSPVNYKDPSGLQAWDAALGNYEHYEVNTGDIEGIVSGEEAIEDAKQRLAGAANGSYYITPTIAEEDFSDGNYALGIGDTYNGLNNDGTTDNVDVSGDEYNSYYNVTQELYQIRDYGQNMMIAGLAISAVGLAMTAMGNPLGLAVTAYGADMFVLGNCITNAANLSLLSLETFEWGLTGDAEGVKEASLNVIIDFAVGKSLRFCYNKSVKLDFPADKFVRKPGKSTYKYDKWQKTRTQGMAKYKYGENSLNFWINNGLEQEIPDQKDKRRKGKKGK